MCQSCGCPCNGLTNAVNNLFGSPCGCFAGIANALNNLFGTNCGCGCSGTNGNNNGGCGCGGYDDYYAQQYALGPYSAGCNVCGY